MPFRVSAGRPGPLSVMTISPLSVDTLMSISGAISASSHASSALSARLFQDNERPILRGMTGLRGQFLFAAELGEPRCLERDAL